MENTIAMLIWIGISLVALMILKMNIILNLMKMNVMKMKQKRII